MKKTFQIRSTAVSKNSSVIEHTPVYDLDAFQQRQKKRKFALLRIQVFKAASIFCMFSFTFSILFLGE